MAVRQITTRLAVDGEQEFKREMSAVGNAMKTLKSEMSLVDAEFKGQANTMEALRKKHDVLSREYDQQAEKVRALEQAVRDASDAYGADSDKVQRYQQQLNRAKASLIDLNDELQENAKYLKEAEDSADGCAKSIDGYGNAVKDTADEAGGFGGKLGDLQQSLKNLRNEDGSFNLGGVTDALGSLKGLLVGGAIVGGAKAVKDAIFDIVESTEEYRKVMGTLETSGAAAGYTAEETAEIYNRFNDVLGDTQKAATATANLQALGLAQEQLRLLVDECIGAWATYGDSIPIDGLSEAVNETVQAGKVTGVFADVLNWAGVSEDEFNAKLAACVDGSERAQLVLTQLAQQGLAETAEAWRQNNEDIIAMNRSQQELNESMARLGELLTPLAAGIVSFTADIVAGVTDAINAIGSLIDKIREARSATVTELASYAPSDSRLSRSRAEARLLEHLNGSHAAGLNYVPFDGYRAELHAGEAVLNAQEAALWRTAGRTLARQPSGAGMPAPAPTSAQSGAQREAVTIDVTLELDGQTLARKQYPLMQSEARRRGTPLAGKDGT